MSLLCRLWEEIKLCWYVYVLNLSDDEIEQRTGGIKFKDIRRMYEK